MIEGESELSAAGTKEIRFEQDRNNKIEKNYTQNRISETGSQISKLETKSDSQNKIGIKLC